MPRWATLLPEPEQAVVLLLAPGSAQAVTFANVYKSWERWYTRVTAPGFELSQAEGTLAPRGGANNACDETKPYSDAHTLMVRCLPTTPVGTEAFLVVQTEEAHWTWRLEVGE